MKKKFAIIFLALFVFTYLLAIVAAQGSVTLGPPSGGGSTGSIGPPLPPPTIVTQLQNIGTGIVQTLEPLFRIFVGDIDNEQPGDFLMKVLFLVIVFALVFMAIERVDLLSSNTFIHWLLSGVVSILAVRFLADQALMQAILLPYSALGVAFSAGFPFVLYFLVVKDFPSRLHRKTAWLFFAVVFFSLWVTRFEDIIQTAKNGWIPYLYLITAAAAIIMMLFDGTISRWRRKIKMEELRSVKRIEQEANLSETYHKILEQYQHNHMSEDRFKAKHKDLWEKSKRLGLDGVIPRPRN